MNMIIQRNAQVKGARGNTHALTSASAELANLAIKPLETISFSTGNTNLPPVVVEDS